MSLAKYISFKNMQKNNNSYSPDNNNKKFLEFYFNENTAIELYCFLEAIVKYLKEDKIKKGVDSILIKYY